MHGEVLLNFVVLQADCSCNSCPPAICLDLTKNDMLDKHQACRHQC